MKYFLFVLFALLFSFGFRSCMENRRELRRLNNKIAELQGERPELYHDSCMRAVNMSCYYADCAVTPIEIMQEKICKPLEEE